MTDNFYQVLGVPENASQDGIKKVYRKLAMQYHPDRNRGSKQAEERFKAISEAYDVLGDEKKRRQYDAMRRAGFGAGGFDGAQGFGTGARGRTYAGPGAGGEQAYTFEDLGGFSGFRDIFENMFRGQAGARQQGMRGGSGAHGRFDESDFGDEADEGRGNDIQLEMTIPFEVAVKGGRREFTFDKSGTCPNCGGNGAQPGTTPDVCPDCKGRGTVTVSQGNFGVQRICPKCGGRGRFIKSPCVVCRGTGVAVMPKTLTVKIPPGIKDGQIIRLAGEGNAGMHGGSSGDLLLHIRVAPHLFFRRDGDKIIIDKVIDIATAVLGGETKVPTLDGELKLKIPAGTQSGTVFRLKGLGVARRGGLQGDQNVIVKVSTPRNLTQKQKELFEEFAKESGLKT
ncbi:MAG: molecular chaperone DnaJ [bacterium]|nr:molecular chaperone DnaJ [Candidatus Sumerlaeota bacterium]